MQNIWHFLNNLLYAEQVTHDFAEGCLDKSLKEFHLLPWFPKSFLNLPWSFCVPDDDFFEVDHNLCSLL